MMALLRSGGVDTCAPCLRVYTSTCLRLASVDPAVAVEGEAATAEAGVRHAA
jgi:hypothetical protein